jgi:hypothetical protein
LAHDYAAAKRALHDELELNPNRLDGHYMLGATASFEHNCAEVRTQFEWCARRVDAPTTKIGLALEVHGMRLFGRATATMQLHVFSANEQVFSSFSLCTDGEEFGKGRYYR